MYFLETVDMAYQNLVTVLDFKEKTHRVYHVSGFRLESLSCRTVQVGGKFFVTGGESHANLCAHLKFDHDYD